MGTEATDNTMSDAELENGDFSKLEEETDDDLQIVVDTDHANEHHVDQFSEGGSNFDSEIDEKEDEFREIDRSKVTEIHENILQHVDSGKLSLKTEADREAFYTAYQFEYIMELNADGSSLLHGLMGNLKRDDDLVFNRRIPLFELLLDLSPRMPTWRDGRHETPLFVAVYKQLHKVVQYMCERSEAAIESLGIPNRNGDTCLHVAIQRELDFSFVDYLINKIGRNKLLQKGDGGNTPLHLAVEWERCKPSQVDLVRRLVELSPASLEIKNNENLAPFQHHLMTRRRSDPNKRESTISSPEARRNKRLGPRDDLLKSAENRYSYESKSKMLPDQMRMNLESKRKRPVAKGSIADAKQIEYYLMLQCMHITDRDKAIDALYGPVQKRAIEFDLWGRKSISDADLKHMEAYLKFEVILQYVAIPRLSVTRSQSGNGEGKMARKLPHCKGRMDYCLIFDWLRECGVKQILKIIVDDEEMPSHSDEIIEISLEGFKLEHWDWQKLDICIETVLKAAPDVKVVHLYSSGNDAVLRGWSDTDGLPKLKNLETVYLVVNQGLESYQRTLEYVRTFKARLTKLCGKIKVIDTIRKPGRPTKDSAVSEKQLQQDKQKQKWLDCMDGFGEFILNYPKEPQEKIKVALIDDGVDIAFQDLGSNIASGVSFCTRENGLYSSYYQSSGGHGTIIASLIRRVCPKARLYVAKLDDKVTAASAAKAISWATQMGVHIISMSWTIQKTSRNAKEIDELEKAINMADRKNILLFCSASDQGNNTKKDQTLSYPAKARPDKMFQIGAATASGKGWDWLGHGHVDYIFPGEKLLLQNRLGSLPETLSGSSLATGLAAGLAALVLYCIEVHNHSDLVSVKNYDRMKEIFNAIGVSDNYVLVWDTFELSREEYTDKTEEEKLRRVVSRLINKGFLARMPTREFK